jgi:hypothetical protein
MFKGLLAIVGAFFLIKYRERVVATTGKFKWAEKYLGQGGTYRLMVLVAIAFFLWGVSAVTGTTDVLLSPLNNFFNPSLPTGGGVDTW